MSLIKLHPYITTLPSPAELSLQKISNCITTCLAYNFIV